MTAKKLSDNETTARQIQEFLNRQLPGPYPLAVDGWAGAKTRERLARYFDGLGLKFGPLANPPRPTSPIETNVFTDAVREEMEALWETMVITDRARFDYDLKKLKAGRSRYEAIAESVNPLMPWWFVGVIHGLECSYSFAKHLHNGDPLSRKTVRVPENRPPGNPPWTFEESARDALTMKYYHLDQDWTLPRILWRLEGFNGYGYRLYRRIFSPYLWAGTNHYVRGKYVDDGIYNPNAVSSQAGSAGLIKLIRSQPDPTG